MYGQYYQYLFENKHYWITSLLIWLMNHLIGKGAIKYKVTKKCPIFANNHAIEWILTLLWI